MTTRLPEFPAALLAAETNARTELQRADAKATTLLSLTTAVLAGVITLAAHRLPGPASIALWASMLPIASAVVLLLSAIRPRLGNGPAPAGSWLDAARSGPGAMLTTWQRDTDESTYSAAEDVCVISRIALCKYTHIRRAIALLLVGLVDLGVAGLCAVVTA